MNTMIEKLDEEMMQLLRRIEVLQDLKDRLIADPSVLDKTSGQIGITLRAKTEFEKFD